METAYNDTLYEERVSKIIKDLTTISMLLPGKTLSSSSMTIIDHNSWTTTLWRTYSGENRKETIQFIMGILYEAINIYLLSPNVVLGTAIDSALDGFETMKETYKTDYYIIADIDSTLRDIRDKLNSVDISRLFSENKLSHLSKKKNSDDGFSSNISEMVEISNRNNGDWLYQETNDRYCTNSYPESCNGLYTFSDISLSDLKNQNLTSEIINNQTIENDYKQDIQNGEKSLSLIIENYTDTKCVENWNEDITKYSETDDINGLYDVYNKYTVDYLSEFSDWDKNEGDSILKVETLDMHSVCDIDNKTTNIDIKSSKHINHAHIKANKNYTNRHEISKRLSGLVGSLEQETKLGNLVHYGE